MTSPEWMVVSVENGLRVQAPPLDQDAAEEYAARLNLNTAGRLYFAVQIAPTERGDGSGATDWP